MQDPVSVESLCWEGVQTIQSRAGQGTLSPQHSDPAGALPSKLQTMQEHAQPKQDQALSQTSDISDQAWFEDISASMAMAQAERSSSMPLLDHDDSGESSSTYNVQASNQINQEVSASCK